MSPRPTSEWTAFRVRVPADDEDVATALLYEAGTTGIEVQPPGGGSVVLLAYFSAGVTTEDLARHLALLSAARVEPAPIPDVDWVARFRETFRVLACGRFRIVPAWEAAEAGAERIVVDPGRAFGTGTHETTRLCLAALEELAGERPLGRVLDVGTGTGILSVAARRLGASCAVASDLDPEATESAQAHARLNAVPLAVVQADGGAPFRAGAFDVVIANLSAPLLRVHAAELLALGAPGSALVLSGLLADDAPELAEAYAPAGPMLCRVEGEWACLVARRP